MESLHILHLEDDPNDGDLVHAALLDDGLKVSLERIETRDQFVAALARGAYDLILSDFSLPQFDGISALRIAQTAAPDLPFIIVSGTLGEDAAVESVRHGATDYVLKQRLARLGTSVRRALTEANERRRRKAAEDALRQSEAQLRQAQKMEAIGRLAGGVAHDFNNLLTVIIGYSEIVRSGLAADAPATTGVREILKAAERAASLTRQLLAFSRCQVLEVRPVDVNALVAGMEALIRRLIGEDITVESVLCPNLGPVRADPGQLEQVIMNLVVNARDAMPQGGSLTIETSTGTFDEEFVRSHPPARPGRYVMFAVRDTGLGMDEATKTQIFEPFFTTKEAGKGTGLGLSMVYGIVKQSGGFIWVQSEPGRGSTFKVYLPQSDEAVSSTPEAHRTDSIRGTETILLVEDEHAVRTLMKETLERYGYTVVEAASGPMALQRVASGLPAIHLLITDIVMPGQSGRELASELRSVLPELTTLYVSGYTDDTVVRYGVLEAGSTYLQKPFTPTALAYKVREVLDARAAGGIDSDPPEGQGRVEARQ